MIKIIAFVFIFFALSFTSAFAAGDNNNSYPPTTTNLIDGKGNVIGKVTTYQRGNILYTDYDFDCPSDCRLQTVTTKINNRTYTHSVTSEEGQTLTQYPDIYITPRDAVLAFDVTNQPYSQPGQLTSDLLMLCPNRYVTSYTKIYNNVPASDPCIIPPANPTPTLTPTTTSSYTYKHSVKTSSLKKYAQNTYKTVKNKSLSYWMNWHPKSFDWGK